MKKANLIVFSTLILLACSDSDLKTVKEGSLEEYPSATIGKAFENTFINSKWDTFESNLGEKIIEFKGVLPNGYWDFHGKHQYPEYAMEDLLVQMKNGCNMLQSTTEDEDITKACNLLSPDTQSWQEYIKAMFPDDCIFAIQFIINKRESGFDLGDVRCTKTDIIANDLIAAIFKK